MGKLLGLFLIFFLICLKENFVKASCLINLPPSEENLPIFKRSFGTRQLKVLNLQEKEFLTLYDDEVLKGYCATKFKPISYEDPSIQSCRDRYYNYDSYRYNECVRNLKPSNFSDLYNIELECKNGVIKFNRVYNFSSNELSCNDFEWKISEATIPLPWCGTNEASYILSTEVYKKNFIFAGLCYNLSNMTLESLHFETNNNFNRINQGICNNSGTFDLDDGINGVKVKHFDELFNTNDFHYDIPNSNGENDFISDPIYNTDFIWQGESLMRVFERYNDALKINWWQGLQHGNWRRFMKAFNKRAKNSVYEVYVGASGRIRVPTEGIGEEKKLKFVEAKRPYPAYIWTYVRAVDQNEEFVFIGFNSPFYEFFDEKEIIFCKDTCKEIPWLKEIQSTFRYSALGVTFCCSPEDVRNSTILRGFPKKYDIASFQENIQNIQSQLETTTAVNIPYLLRPEPLLEMENDDDYREHQYDE